MTDSVIKKPTADQAPELARIVFRAYPAPEKGSLEDCQNFCKRETEHGEGNFYGAYRDDYLVGAMVLFDFKLNLLSTGIHAGGASLVCVDFLHKKEKVAKDLIFFFLTHYRNRNINMAMLYPFNMEFYKKMGFGHGAKIYQYRVQPIRFVNRCSKEGIIYLGKDDKERVIACYQRFHQKTNGSIMRLNYQWEKIFHPNATIVGYQKEDQILGYAILEFKRINDNFHMFNLAVQELVYEDTEALLKICAFIHSQADQIRQVIVNTYDEFFFHLLSNPENGHYEAFKNRYHEISTIGTGVMYRIINIKGIFEEMQSHNYGDQTCKLAISIKDSFIKENESTVIVHIENGKAQVIDKGNYEVMISLDISDFSSLLVGAVDFLTLHTYGLAEISDQNYLYIVNDIFKVNQKPVCLSWF